MNLGEILVRDVVYMMDGDGEVEDPAESHFLKGQGLSNVSI